MIRREPQYIPPLGWHWLMPFHDWLTKPFGAALRRELLRQAAIQPGQQVLDLGYGTRIMAIALKGSVPGAQVTALGADERALTIAQGEAAREGADIQWDRGLAYNLPYPDNSLGGSCPCWRRRALAPREVGHGQTLFGPIVICAAYKSGG